MRVLIADDSVLLREGLGHIVTEGGHEVVASVGTGDELVARARVLRPDLVISDIRMPPSHTDEGLRAAVALRESWRDAPILLLSQYVVLSYAAELLASGSGAIGYLLGGETDTTTAIVMAVLGMMTSLGARTKVLPGPGLLARMKAAGRVAAEAFLAGDADNIGLRDSVDLPRLYG